MGKVRKSVLEVAKNIIKKNKKGLKRMGKIEVKKNEM